MAMKRTWIIIGLAAAMGVALAAIYYSKPGRAPAGQAALTAIDSQALSKLQAEFNRTESSVRVILLLSPT
jgi:hypothetical protein